MTNKITIAVLAITAILMSSCQLDTGNHFSEKESIYTVEEIEGRNGGSITINNDVVMLVNTGSPLVHVNYVDILDNADTYITTFGGCNNQECRIDLSSLVSGDYKAIAFPSIGGSFSHEFTLNN